jgi:hypothetical protein
MKRTKINTKVNHLVLNYEGKNKLRVYDSAWFSIIKLHRLCGLKIIHLFFTVLEAG